MIRRCIAVAGASVMVALALAPAAAAATPSIDHFTFERVFIAPGLSATCGFPIVRDQSGQVIDTVYSDGSERIDETEVDIWTANGKSITERDAFSIYIALDGTVTLVGANYHAIQPGTGLIVIDAGRVAWNADGDIVVLDGPHPVVLHGRGPTFCAALAP